MIGWVPATFCREEAPVRSTLRLETSQALAPVPPQPHLLLTTYLPPPRH